MKKYIDKQMRRFLTFGIIMFVLCLIVFILPIIISPFSYDCDSINHGALVSVAVIFASIVPLFAYENRFSLKKQDFYKQAPISSWDMIRAKLFISICYILAIYVVCFALGILAYVIRYPIKTNGSYLIFDYITIELLICGFFYGLVYIVVMFLISSFIVSRCNTMNSAISMLLSGHLLLSLIIPFFMALFGVRIKNPFYVSNPPIGLAGLFLMENVFSPGYIEDFSSKTTVINVIIGCVANVILATLCALGVIKQKEPSGEFAGKTDSDNKIHFVIIHSLGFFGIGAVILSAHFAAVNGSILFVALEMVYVVLNFMRLRAIKFSKKEMIAMGINVFCGFVFVIVGSII